MNIGLLNTRIGMALVLCTLPFAVSRATLLAYDGFDSDTYLTGSDGTGADYPADNLSGQGAGAGSGFTSTWGAPITDGQALGDHWLNTDDSASGSYYRASTGQNSYTDGNSESLQTTDGQAVFSGNGTRVSLQQFTSSGSDAPAVLYMSALVTLDGSATDVSFGFASAPDSGNPRPFTFGFNSSGNLTAAGWDEQSATSSGTYGVGTYLLVARAAETTGSGDTLDVWLNPLLGDESGSGAATVSISGGGFYVDGSSTWSIDGLVVDSQGTGSVTLDELRVGETFNDVTPSAIPEPSTLMLSALALCGLAVVRLSRKRDCR